MPPALTWKMGIEIELMEPPGGSREALARTVAARVGGSVERHGVSFGKSDSS